MKFLKGIVFSGAVALSAAGAAQAAPISGTFDVSIYQAICSGCTINSPGEQAQTGNPYITSSDLITKGTYVGSLDWQSNGTGDGNIGTFMASDGGTYTPTTGNANHALSSSPFGLTTVFVITGSTSDLLGGTISHDDGASLYGGAGYSHLVAGSPSPTSEIPTSFTGLTGSFELIYVEANGLPADLVMNITSSKRVPEPVTIALFGAGLAGVGALRRRRKAAAA
jgi:hypothetical protein